MSFSRPERPQNHKNPRNPKNRGPGPPKWAHRPPTSQKIMILSSKNLKNPIANCLFFALLFSTLLDNMSSKKCRNLSAELQRKLRSGTVAGYIYVCIYIYIYIYREREIYIHIHTLPQLRSAASAARPLQ